MKEILMKSLLLSSILILALQRNALAASSLNDPTTLSKTDMAGSIIADSAPATAAAAKDVGPSLDGFPLTTQEGPLVRMIGSQAVLVYPLPLKPGYSVTSDKGDVLPGAPMKSPDFPTGFLVRDVATSGTITPVALKGMPQGKELTQRGAMADLALTIEAKYEPSGSGTKISGEITDTTGKDRAITLYYALPVPKDSLVWWDDVRQSKPIAGSRDFLSTKAMPAGATKTHSFYPLCAVTNKETGLSISVPMDRPVLYRLGYSPSTERLYVAFDFALTQSTKKFPGKAAFSFNVTSTDPKWGFRSALDNYYTTFPQFFTKLVKQEGCWVFADILQMEHPEDFGFMFHEMGGSKTKLQPQIDLDDKIGALSFRYTTPAPYNLSMKPEDPRKYDVMIQRWHEQEKKAIGRQPALSQEVCGITLEDGTFWHQFVKLPWVSGARMCQNPDPELPSTDKRPNRARVNYDPDDKDGFYPNGKIADTGSFRTASEFIDFFEKLDDSGLDGEYLDSLGIFTDRLNFRREHFAYADYPLTFASGSKAPVLPMEWSLMDFCKWESDDLHSKGKMLMVNFYPKTFPFIMTTIDAPGTEVWWHNEKTGYQPDPDMYASLNYWRAMSWQKPYLLLMKGDFKKQTHAMVEIDFRRSLAFGMYPSFFDSIKEVNGKFQTYNYFQTPELYNRDRDLFKKYIPLVRRVNMAGWQPMTRATSDDPQVWIERFGSVKKGNLALTVLNSTHEKKSVTLKLDAALGVTEGMQISDLVDGTAVNLTDGSTLKFELDADDAAVLEFSTAD